MRPDDAIREAVRSFGNCVSAGRTAHAYVIVGPPRGEAMDFVLQALGILFGVEAGGESELATHPDIIWIEPQKKSRVISVDDVREVRRRMSQTAFAGGWKSCVVSSADRLGQEASNAFLKTLEEPAGRSVFFLLTDQPEALLPTIVSRCRRIALTNVRDSLPEDCRQELAAILSGAGSVDSMSGIIPAKRVGVLLEGIKKRVEKETAADMQEGEDDDTLEARSGARYREIRTAVLRFIMLWYRDVLLSVCSLGQEFLCNAAYAAQIRGQAERMTYGEALRKVEAVERMREQFERNMPEGPVLGMGFLRLSSEC